jgi:hypothetical protein
MTSCAIELNDASIAIARSDSLIATGSTEESKPIEVRGDGA